MMNRWLMMFGLALFVLGPSGAFGQVDTFEDGTTMGWGVTGGTPGTVHPAPPVNVNTGGPAGGGDSFLRVTAVGGIGAGSELSVQNGSQWAQDYLAEGLSAIRMDVNNFGPGDLYLRLLFEDFPAAPGPPENVALSAAAVFVPAGSGWMQIAFPIESSDLISPLGTAAAALGDTDVLRIFHNPLAEFPGPPGGIPAVNAQLGIDNVRAVPEPAGLVLGMMGCVACWRRVRGRETRALLGPTRMVGLCGTGEDWSAATELRSRGEIIHDSESRA
jgi:hypothetical protein